MSKSSKQKKTFIELAEKIKADKIAAFNAKYNSGNPTTIVLPVHVKSDFGSVIEHRTFIFDNFLDIHHKLIGLVLIDMGTLHNGGSSYAIKTNTVNVEGSLPAHIFNFPRFTKRKKGTSPEDLRKECYDI